MGKRNLQELKEKEKEHLRKIQELKQRLKEAERLRSIGSALNSVEAAGSSDEFDQALRQVQLEALESEARLDSGLDAASDDMRSEVSRDVGSDLEEASTEARASELVRHMKLSMGLSEADERKRTTSEDTSGAGDDADKTIGRMKSADE